MWVIINTNSSRMNVEEVKDVPYNLGLVIRPLCSNPGNPMVNKFLLAICVNCNAK